MECLVNYLFMLLFIMLLFIVIICQQLFLLTINKSTLFTDTKKLILFFSGIEGEQRVQEGMFSGFWFEVDNQLLLPVGLLQGEATLSLCGRSSKIIPVHVLGVCTWALRCIFRVMEVIFISIFILTYFQEIDGTYYAPFQNLWILADTSVQMLSPRPKP